MPSPRICIEYPTSNIPWSPPLAQVIATEDFPLLPKMQRNFAESVHAEVGFGLGCIVVARVALLLTPALGSYARFTERIGASISETTM
jgi:hypothetical protein